MTRLLIVIIDLYGGTGTFCRTLANGLKQYYPNQFNISLLLVRSHGITDADRTLFDQIHIVGGKIDEDWRRSYQTPIQMLRLAGAVRRAPADVVLAVGTFSNLLVSMTPGGRHIVLSEHVNVSQRLSRSPWRNIFTRFMKWRYPPFPVTAPCKEAADDLRRNFGVPRATGVYHGVDRDRLRRLAESPVDDLPARPYLISCGFLNVQKDFATLIQAFARARTRGLEQELLIIGDGPKRGELTEIVARLDLSNHVHMPGFRANPFPYMRHADFFALSSIWEGFGLVILEAMALGLPVMAARCPSGPGEILGEGQFGLLFKPGDVDAAAKAMLELGQSAATRQHWSQRSLQRAGELTVQRMVRQYYDLLIPPSAEAAHE